METKETRSRDPPQGGSWILPVGFFVLLGLAVSGINWVAAGWVFLLSILSTQIFLFSISYRRKRFGKKGGTVHPAHEEEERNGDKFLAGLVLSLSLFLPESIVYVLGAATFIILTSRIFIR